MDENTEEDAVPDGTQKINLNFASHDGSHFNISANTPSLGRNVQIGTGMVMVVPKSHSAPTVMKKAKKPLSKRQELVTRDLVENVSKDINKIDAERLGRYFHLTEAKLDEINSNYNVEGAREIKYQILAEWMRKDENPSLEKLAAGLNAVGRGDIADKIPH